MQKKFDDLLKTRKFLLKITAHLSNEQLNKIPAPFKNNIAWNLAHLVVTQQLLCYKLSGLKCLVSEERNTGRAGQDVRSPVYQSRICPMALSQLNSQTQSRSLAFLPSVLL